MTAAGTSSSGISPTFPVTSEDLTLRYLQGVTRFALDGVEPPNLGAQGGTSVAFSFTNYWSPWIDEKLVSPKFDGVCQYIGMMSNRPSHVKDFHAITLMRAVDYMMAPVYTGFIVASVDTVVPIVPGTPGG